MLSVLHCMWICAFVCIYYTFMKLFVCVCGWAHMRACALTHTHTHMCTCVCMQHSVYNAWHIFKVPYCKVTNFIKVDTWKLQVLINLCDYKQPFLSWFCNFLFIFTVNISLVWQISSPLSIFRDVAAAVDRQEQFSPDKMHYVVSACEWIRTVLKSVGYFTEHCTIYAGNANWECGNVCVSYKLHQRSVALRPQKP